MKKKVVNWMICVIIFLLIICIVVFYIYDVTYNNTPVMQNLFRTVSLVLVLLVTVIRVFYNKRRRSLDFYEKSYEKELGYAFKNKPFNRKKLLCATRLYNESNYDKALKYLFQLNKEVENEHDAVPVLLFAALCYTDMGLNEAAIKIYYKLLEIDCRNEQVHSNLGLLYTDEGNYDMALKHYNESIKCKPGNYYAYVNRASCYFKQKDYPNAIKDAEKALEFRNNGHEAASLLAIIYALQGDRENKEKYAHIYLVCGKNPDDLKNAIEHYMKEKE